MTGYVEGVLLTPLKTIPAPGGDVKHAMKLDDPGYMGFGEAYFSSVVPGVIKGWKRHREMTLNLVVSHGQVRFVIYDDRADSLTSENFQDVTLSVDNYQRLTVPPMVWMAFQGGGEEGGMLLNIASIPHDPTESDRKSVNEIEFNWSINQS